MHHPEYQGGELPAEGEAQGRVVGTCACNETGTVARYGLIHKMIDTAISLSTRGHFRILKSGHFNFLLTTDRGTADKPFISGTTHRYAVAAYRNEEGNWSNEVEAVAQGEPPPRPEEPETSLAAPTGLTVTATSETSVSLTWTAPADGVLGYNVYRCRVQAGETTCDLEWHAWVANEGDAPPAPTSYTDTVERPVG